MESARQAYIDIVDAVEAQRARLGLGDSGATRWDASAARFTADPRREPDANLKAILEYIEPDDVVVDVGGGGGRYALPIALHCKEVINVEPSTGMGEAFEASARESGIANVRWVPGDWMAAEGVTGDVSLVVNVTYFVRDVLPFLEKLQQASRKRVIIATSIAPPPNQSAGVFELTHGEPQVLVPGYRDVLGVLWEMGIVPDVRVLHSARATALGGTYEDRDTAIESLHSARVDDAQWSRLRSLFEAYFDDLFEAVPSGFRRKPSGDQRMILVTWRTDA